MKDPYGVLIFTGFAETADCAKGLQLRLEEQGLPTHVPVLRGHGAASPQALHGITWHDWMTDAGAALEHILTQADKAIIVGHSMGALVALMLAADHADQIDSIM